MNQPTLKAIAKALDVSERTVSRLRAEGMPCTSLDEARQWYRDRCERLGAIEREKIAASLRWRQAQRRQAQLERDIQRGILVSASAVKNRWWTQARASRDRCMGLSRSALPAILEGKSPDSIRRALRQSIEWALSPLHQSITQGL